MIEPTPENIALYILSGGFCVHCGDKLGGGSPGFGGYRRHCNKCIELDHQGATCGEWESVARR